MRFPGIRLVKQTEQNFRRFESVLKKKKKTSDCNSRALLLIKAPTEKRTKRHNNKHVLESLELTSGVKSLVHYYATGYSMQRLYHFPCDTSDSKSFSILAQ